MACTVKISGKEMSEAEFYSWLIDGGLNDLVDAGKVNLKAVGQTQSKSQVVNLKADIDRLEDKLLEKHKGLKTLFLSENKGALSVDMIEVNPDERNKGVGTSVMNDIIEYADANNMEIQLVPAVKDDNKGTTSRGRLVKFYKGLGFIENKGRNIDFTKRSGSMYRNPQGFKSKSQIAEDVIEDYSSKSQSNTLGIASDIWDTSIDKVVAAMKSGKPLGEALDEAVDYIKSTHGEFDEKSYRKGFETRYNKFKKNRPVSVKRVRGHFDTISSNPDLKNAVATLNKVDFIYDTKTQDQTTKEAEDYIAEVGVEQAYMNFVDNKFPTKITEDVKVAISSLLATMMDAGIAKAIENNDQETADEIWRDMERLSDVTSKMGTAAGRAVNAYKRFTVDFYNPITAVFYAMKISEAANNKVREKGINKRSSKRIANDVKGKVNAGKKSVASDVAKNLPKNEIKGLIANGVNSKTSETVKGKISGFFDSLKESFGNIDLTEITKASKVKSKSQTVNAAVKFVEKVKEKFMKGGVTLSQAMLETSAEMIKDGSLTPPQALELRKKMSGAVNQSNARVQTEQAKALKEATAEFNAKEALKKELEKDRERREALKAKELEAQKNRIETQAAKLEAAKTAEEIKQADRRIKEKEELQRELEKENQRIADLRAAEAQAIKDRVAKMELERAKSALAQAEKDKKSLEDKIKKFTSDVLKSNEEIVEQIIDEYLDLQGGAQTNNAILIDMVKDRLGLDDMQAKKVATQIANGVNKKIKEKLINKYGSMLTEEERQAKKDGRKPPIDPLSELIRASKLGVLEAEQAVMTLFQNKYGITSFNQQDAAKVKEISNKISSATTPERRNKAVAEMANYLARKNPVSFSDLMNELWYFKTLSSVLTVVLGTADVNNKYNINQLITNSVEMPITSFLSSIRMRKGQTIGQVVQNALDGIMYGAAKAIFQQLQTNKSEQDGVDNFANILWQSKGNLLSESITYLREVLANGQSGLQEMEKPFETKTITDFDIKRWFEQSRRGDEFAKKKIAKLMFAAINSPIRGVPRILAGSDAFFGGIVKNAYIPMLLMEKYYNEGLRGAALNQKVLQELVASKEATEQAYNNAVDARMSNDITFEQRGSSWVILDRGKLQKGSFDSLAEAKDHAKDHVANRGLQFRKDLIFFMNSNIGTESIDAATRISQRDLLSGPTEGLANYVYTTVIQGVANTARKSSDFLNAAAKTQGGPEWNAVVKMFGTGELKDGGVAVTRKMIALVLKGLAIITKSLGNLVAYSRVGLNLVRKSSNYILPIGMARYGMARAYNRSMFGLKYKDTLTAVEQEKIMAQAIVGSVYLLAFTSAVAGAKQLINKMIDDDDEAEKKETSLRKASIAKKYKEDTGEDLPEHVLDYIVSLKPGDVVGSMAFLDDLVGGKGRRAYYNKTGIIKENSIFRGIDSNGNYIFDPLIGTPEASFAMALGTYLTYQNLVSDEEKSQLAAIGWTLYQPMSTFFDMSIGQGIGKLAAGDKSITEKGEAVLQTVFLDNLEMANPDIIKKPLQYWDQKQRVTMRLSDYLKEAPSFKEGVNNYLLNSCTPVYGAVYAATKAPQVYGMFGEELYKIPSQEQGAISHLMARYIQSDKNLKEKAMYDWLGANGYEKIWSAPKEQPIVNEAGKAEILSKEKRSEYGRIAGKKSFEDISKMRTVLQDIQVREGKDAFIREVNNIFKENFKEAYSIGEGLATKEEFDRYLPVKQENFETKLENKIEAAQDLKEAKASNPLTPEEEAQAKLISAQKEGFKDVMILKLMKRANKADVPNRLDKFVEHKIISQEEADKVLYMMGLETPL